MSACTLFAFLGLCIPVPGIPAQDVEQAGFERVRLPDPGLGKNQAAAEPYGSKGRAIVEGYGPVRLMAFYRSGLTYLSTVWFDRDGAFGQKISGLDLFLRKLSEDRSCAVQAGDWYLCHTLKPKRVFGVAACGPTLEFFEPEMPDSVKAAELVCGAQGERWQAAGNATTAPQKRARKSSK